jgi:SAM-dependent methyltransferase
MMKLHKSFGTIEVWDDGQNLLVYDVLPVTPEVPVASSVGPKPLIFDNEYLNFAYIGLCCLEETPQEILLLGLGAGSFYRAIRTQDMFVDIKAVEVSKTMIDVAKELCKVQDKDVVQADARQYLKTVTDASKDFIFMDMFDSTGKVPNDMLSAEFLGQCKNLLIMDGIFVLNYIYYGNQEEAIQMAETLLSLYGKKSVRILEFNDNWVFICKVSDEDRGPTVNTGSDYYKNCRGKIDIKRWLSEEIGMSKLLYLIS